MKTFNQFISEAKKVTIDIDVIDPKKSAASIKKKFGKYIKVKEFEVSPTQPGLQLTGPRGPILAWMLDNGWDMIDVEDMYPELLKEALNPMQKQIQRQQKVFDKLEKKAKMLLKKYAPPEFRNNPAFLYSWLSGELKLSAKSALEQSTVDMVIQKLREDSFK